MSVFDFAVQAATQYLEKQGCKVLETNSKAGFDIVAKDKSGCICLVDCYADYEQVPVAPKIDDDLRGEIEEKMMEYSRMSRGEHTEIRYDIVCIGAHREDEGKSAQCVIRHSVDVLGNDDEQAFKAGYRKALEDMKEFAIGKMAIKGGLVGGVAAMAFVAHINILAEDNGIELYEEA